jgi:hypothetical protein
MSRSGLAHPKRRSVLATFRLAAIGALALELLLAAASSAGARDLSTAEREALDMQIATFEKAFRANDYDTVIGTIPPKLMAAIAGKSGVSVDVLRQAMIARTKEGMASVKLLNFRFEATAASIRLGADGTPYAVVPTFMVMELGNKRVEITSSTLGFMDEGRWYLLRLENPSMVALLQQVYPSLANVEVPRESRRTLE